MPLHNEIRTIAAKIEDTPGTAETLAAADAALDVYEPTIQATIEMEERNAQGAYNKYSQVAGQRMGTVTFRTDVTVGATALPEWATTFLPACGWVESTNVYTPRSGAVGSNVKTLTIGVYENGLLKSIAGAMGTFRIVCPAGRLAFIEWTFTGVWQDVTDTAILTPTHPADTPIRFASATCTYDSTAQRVENLTIDAGNNVIMREDPTTASGYIAAAVTNRYPKITANPESTLVTDDDHYGDWLSAGEAALAVTLNGPSSSSLAISAPAAQIINCQEGDRNGIQIDDIEWACNKNGANQDQELSLTFTLES